jgi:TonB family protein
MNTIKYSYKLTENKISFFIIPIYLFTINIYSNTSTSLIDNRIEEPKMLFYSPVLYPVSLIKQGIEGNVVLDIYIDIDGSVEKVDIVKNIHPILDSLAKQSAKLFKFRPAILEGNAVPVIIRYQYVFDTNHIIETTEYSPNFIGTVIDADSRKPLCNFNIICSFTDTTKDTSLTIPFFSYIKKIAHHKNQHYIDEKLITTTDSLGKFYFYLLPTCSLKIILNPIMHKRYEINETILPNTITNSIYPISIVNNLNNENYKIIVYGKKSDYETINVQRAELKYGLKDDINKIISMRSEVNFIPGKRSTLLVNGGGPYDNRYEIYDIPIFSPSHFSTIPTLDVSGIMLSTIENISIISSNMCGRYSQSPGCVIKMNPGIYRPVINKWIKRPETTVNMSIRHMDFNIYSPFRNNKDSYQIGFRFVHNYLVKTFGMETAPSLNGLSTPTNYNDLTFTGITNFNNISMRSFIWSSLDIYIKNDFNDEYIIPWGIGSITLRSKKKTNLFKAVLGGSSQKYFEGKLMGTTAPLKKIERKNATVLLTTDSLSIGRFTLNLKERIEYIHWKNKLTERYYTNKTPVEEIKLNYKLEEIFAESHVGLKYSTKKFFSCGVNLLMGSEIKSKNHYIDPGAWINIGKNNRSFSFFGGIVSSQPDMRGLPAFDYRKEINKTYIVSSLIKRNVRNKIFLSYEPYFRKRNHCPIISYDYSSPIWDKDFATPLYSLGNNFSLDIKSTYYAINIAGMFGKSYRLINDKKKPYEWNIPWALKSTIHCNLKNDWFHIFLTNMMSAGIPYRDINTNKLKRTIPYIRPDISFEYHTKIIDHRYFTRYDIYIGMINIIGRENFSEFYWNEKYCQRAINLLPRYFYFGGRFCFRH